MNMHASHSFHPLHSISLDILLLSLKLYFILRETNRITTKRTILRKFSFFRLKDIGDKNVWNAFAVAIPVLAVLLGTALHVARDTVGKDDDKEAEVKVGQERTKASDQAPGESHEQV